MNRQKVMLIRAVHFMSKWVLRIVLLGYYSVPFLVSLESTWLCNSQKRKRQTKYPDESKK